VHEVVIVRTVRGSFPKEGLVGGTGGVLPYLIFPEDTRHPAGFSRLCGEYGVTAVPAEEKVFLHPTVQERSHPVATGGGMSRPAACMVYAIPIMVFPSILAFLLFWEICMDR